MHTDCVTGQEGHGYRAILHPHRSLSPKGFLILISLICLVSFVTGMVFLLLGAWPVMGFFGLDVLLVYWAFKLNYRAGRLHELVELSNDELTVTRVQASGRRYRFSFNPYWVRVRVEEQSYGPAELKLVSHGKELRFGRFLTDDEKHEFAAELDQALQSNRNAIGG